MALKPWIGCLLAQLVVSGCVLENQDDLMLDDAAAINVSPMCGGRAVPACDTPEELTLPDNCTSFGQNAAGAHWLHKWRKCAVDRFNVGEIQNYWDSGCNLTNADKDAIKTACAGHKRDSAIINCMGTELRRYLTDPDKVCRHHTHCLKDLLRSRWIWGNFEGGYLAGETEGGHAWLEIQYLNARVYVDSYNNGIAFSCPGGRPLAEIWNRGLF